MGRKQRSEIGVSAISRSETVAIDGDGNDGFLAPPQKVIPTLVPCKYQVSSDPGCCCWQPMPDVTPNFAEESNVEVSFPTL